MALRIEISVQNLLKRALINLLLWKTMSRTLLGGVCGCGLMTLYWFSLFLGLCSLGLLGEVGGSPSISNSVNLINEFQPPTNVGYRGILSTCNTYIIGRSHDASGETH